jgi:menaquinone-specific isochorismate synthase
MTAPLHAVTLPLPDDTDLLGALGPGDFVFKRNGVGLIASGVTARVPLDRVEDGLRSIASDDRVRRCGTGPIAVGAIPFDRIDATLRIPRRIIGVDHDGAWVTQIFGGEAREPDHVDPPAVDRVMGRAEWDAAVANILEHIDAGDVEKVVLSRRAIVEARGTIDPVGVIRRLAAQRPDAWVYADAGFVGVTPELLISRNGDRVRSLPMAGTLSIDLAHEIPKTPRLVHEFRVVVDAIADILRASCRDLHVTEPAPTPAGNVAHLSSEVTGILTDPARTALDLAMTLHPTPAVGGTPLVEALELIDKLEPTPRGRYAGPVGWMDASGDGEFAVALRCAEISGNRAVLYAGNGIVAGSDPADEWTETVAKLVAMRRVLESSVTSGVAAS